VAADSQGAGRGRLGRTWFSPPGANLHASLLARPGGTAAGLFPVTLLVGAVVAESLTALGLPALVKWPNDVLVGGKKVAGVLTEMATLRGEVRHVVVGIGLNVNTRQFPEALSSRATSLGLLLGRGELSRAELLADLLNRFEPAYDAARRQGAGPVLERFRLYARFPQPCRVSLGGGLGEASAAVAGTAVDVEPSGALLLIDGQGKTRRIVSGEVTLEDT